MLSGYVEIRDAAERTRQKQLAIEAAPIESMERAQTKEPVGGFCIDQGARIGANPYQQRKYVELNKGPERRIR